MDSASKSRWQPQPRLVGAPALYAGSSLWRCLGDAGALYGRCSGSLHPSRFQRQCIGATPLAQEKEKALWARRFPEDGLCWPLKSLPCTGHLHPGVGSTGYTTPGYLSTHPPAPWLFPRGNSMLETFIIFNGISPSLVPGEGA